MESKAKHTKGKLGIAEPSGIVGKRKEGDRLIYQLDTKEHICEVVQYRNYEHTDEETSVANAAHIVRCWNSHYGLMEALKEISKGEGAYDLDRAQHAWNTIVNMKNIAQQALAKAGG